MRLLACSYGGQALKTVLGLFKLFLKNLMHALKVKENKHARKHFKNKH